VHHRAPTNNIPGSAALLLISVMMAEDICDRMLASGATQEDCIATITRITAKALADAYERWGPADGIDEFYLGGGGSYNPNIIEYIQKRMPKTRIALLDEIGIPAGSREAI
jgi:1,6-anhydro-N-acetylmuramate kinase